MVHLREPPAPLPEPASGGTCGITPADLPRISDRSDRASGDGSSVGGSGLSLATSTRILELHEWPIEARRTPGQGTTFAFGLPVVAMAPGR